MNKIVKPKFLKGIELPQSYFQVPDPYHDAPSNGVSLLALSKYARSQNKRIVDLSRKDAPVDIGFSRKKVMKIICIIFPLYHRITNIQCRNLNPRYDIRINRF